MGHPVPLPPPPAPPGLQARLDALPLDVIDDLLRRLTALAKVIRANPPAGRVAEILLLEGALVLIQQVSGDRHAATFNPPPTADAELTQATGALTKILKGN